MRTTLNLDDDVLEVLKQYADVRSIALGQAASELVRRGLEAPVQTHLKNGFHAVILPPAGKKITSEQVKRLLEDEF
ncbi:MAG TPA: hypothetical protein VMH04_20390 [Candidatus Solibacter sp.]|nr:hypothetical protein [Candidatus Solibacter sp.]